MSNPLFASHMMQMAYLCKEVVKPKELYGCWTCNNSLTDISSYNRPPIQSSVTSEFYSGYALPCIRCASTSIYSIYPNDIDLSSPWSLDFWGRGLGETTLNFGALYLYSRTGDGSWFLSNGSTRLYGSYWANPFQDYNNEMHQYAFGYDGSTIYVYKDGGISRSYATTFTGSASVATIKLDYTNNALANVRCVQKFIGTASSYPVQNTPYTGYESL